MKLKSLFTKVLTIVLVVGLFECVMAEEPVNPNTTPEAKALLDLFYRISGKYTFTGQHNYPNTKDRNSKFATKYSGQTPAVWSTDMGFAEDGDTDSYLARPDIVREAIRQHKKGSIVTICWHAVPPTADEPITFQPSGSVAPDSLASVSGQILDEQFKDILTPGTKLYNRWAAQVDSIAVYLLQLQEANIPVIWRPYHEMNGDWFWWGGRVGENSTIDLYKQLYDRLVNHHKLNNLVWVWSIDRPSTPIRKFSNFYPGNEYLDILAIDIYGSDYNQAYYDSLMVLSNGKPMVLGEVGNPPTLDIIDAQPNWGYWVVWAGMVKNISKAETQKLVNNPRILSQEDATYWKVMNPFREACGLPVLPLEEKYPVNFSGDWILNDEKSEISGMMGGNAPYKMVVDQDGDIIFIKKYAITEWSEDKITNEDILLDGTEMVTIVFNTPRVATASWDEETQSIKIVSQMKFTMGDRDIEVNGADLWSLDEDKKTLKIVQTSSGFRGETKSTFIFEKE